MRRLIPGAVLTLAATTAIVTAAPAEAPIPAPKEAVPAPVKVTLPAACGSRPATRKAFRARAMAVMKSPKPLTAKRGKKVWSRYACLLPKSKARGRQIIQRLKRWRRQPDVKWWLRWHRMSPAAKAWTRNVSANESYIDCRNQPAARLALGARCTTRPPFDSWFQWLPATWYAACGCGIHPDNASWHHQAVKAWAWHLSHPRGQWPNTGE